MKKKLFILLAIGLIVASLMVGCGQSQIKLDIFEVSEEVVADLGAEFIVEPVIAYDTNGNEYDTEYKVFCGEEEVAVTNNKFLISKLETYKVVYTFTGSKDPVSKTMKITVKDIKSPLIVFNKFKNITKNGMTVKTPTIKITDNSNQIKTSELKVFYKDETEEITYSKPDKSEFIVNKPDGFYKIVATACDKSDNKSEKTDYIYIKNENELENFDNKDFVSNPSNFDVLPNAEISFNDNKDYVLQGAGSLKFVSKSDNNMAYPEFVLLNPGIIDISEYESFSFYVFNDYDAEINLNVANNAHNNFYLMPHCWNRIEITKNNYASFLSGDDGKGNITGGYLDMRNLRIWIYKGDCLDKDVTLYFDNFCVNKNLNNKISYKANFENDIYVIKDEEIALNTPTVSGLNNANINTSLVNFATKTRTKIPNNKLKISNSGKYRLCFEAIDETAQVVVSHYYDFIAVNTVKYDENEIDNFNTVDKTYMWTQVQDCSIEYAEQNNNGCMKVNILLYKGYAAFDTDLARIAKLAEKYNEFSFSVKNTGKIKHEILINTVVVGEVNPDEELTITVNNEQFKKILTAKATGGDKDLFREGRFSVFVRNSDEFNENATLYFDNFICK